MRKNRVYKMMFAVTMGTACVLAAGCGEKETSKSVLSKCYKNIKDVKSVEGSSEIKIDMAQSDNQIAVNVFMDTKMVQKSNEMSAEGNVRIEALGSENSMEFDVYQVKEEDQYVQYMEMMEQCMKETIDADDVQQVVPVESFGMMKKLYEEFELSGKTVEIDGKECYQLKGIIKGEDFEKAIDAKMLETLGLNEIFSEDIIKNLELPCEIAIDKKEMMPVSMKMDMKETMGDMGLSSLGIEVKECYMEQKFEKFNTVDKIEVPKEVQEKAQDGSSLEGDLNSFGAEAEQEQEAEMSPDLAGNWDSYMVQINDTVLTLPCEYSQLQALGFTLDTDSISDTLLKPEQFTIAFVKDQYGNQIMLDLINRTSEDLPLEQCMVGGIEASDTFLKGGLTVMLPGGIKAGSTRDELIHAYGEASNVESVSESEQYSWEDSSSFYKNCDVLVETATGIVESISIRNYDK